MIQYRSNIEDYNGVQAVVENVDFFETGCGLVPVNMSEVARALDPHTSTMSRAVQDKYIVCAAGTVALKSLFEKGVPGISGKTVSKTLAKQQIVQFISKEDASNPLSDKDLRIALHAVGIDISRRTVMKYREELGFDSSVGRRRR